MKGRLKIGISGFQTTFFDWWERCGAIPHEIFEPCGLLP